MTDVLGGSCTEIKGDGGKTFGRFHFEKPNIWVFFFVFLDSTSLGIVFGRKSNRFGLLVILV